MLIRDKIIALYTNKHVKLMVVKRVMQDDFILHSGTYIFKNIKFWLIFCCDVKTRKVRCKKKKIGIV